MLPCLAKDGVSIMFAFKLRLLQYIQLNSHQILMMVEVLRPVTVLMNA